MITENKTITLSFSLVALCLFFSTSFAGEGVATAIIVKGEVRALDKKNNQMFVVKPNDELEIGTMIQTNDKSFIKLLFLDKSQMSLGPNSKMAITAFSKNDPGIITLINGKLRSQVTKNYMEIEEKDKSKLFVKTPNAAMGVRGTDFQVDYFAETKKTALITFSGAVAMAKLEEGRGASERNNYSQKILDKILASKEAVVVRRGEFSGVAPERSAATPPIKISPAQLELLKNDQQMINGEVGKKESKETSSFRAPIPPGLNRKQFENETTAVDKKIAEERLAVATFDKKNEHSSVAVPIPSSGGFVDMRSGEYIRPEIVKNSPDFFANAATNYMGSSGPTAGERTNLIGDVRFPRPASVGGIYPALIPNIYSTTYEVRPPGEIYYDPVIYPIVATETIYDRTLFEGDTYDGILDYPVDDGTINTTLPPADVPPPLIAPVRFHFKIGQ
ncbi:MAG: hypothetical protein A2504_02765 [Bdellovibrionales bacterium RIFOXYD12_FULL_39_22]|nr:MAG: hypothetical protein A2385_05480 [Bdellovibrionales bacterium RIFOXYB1_FULL_39_21]OFZ42208.1 MAG: hypothetical protein A2485_15510 [Bdellovibrionales bacterium RIFOXYC12_FULL_39_17]OFZ46700.1 MAG: hypothetical protein A2404_04160 [Bdellovibrionales bacterium RIFOXYC1_FULL_39_130]OFZ74233.1 MAG: hypothetical protein A2451_02190 [Bdellovibrionales bacterium RIFOXYC2_FULL_39_8]OFZ76023.1 MAG: hypothetical protein A2560_02990 [Bdellovibrionales bacterium RIFOXYD1_FULL_39_84]OFZ93007.1 MAG: